MSKKWLHGAIPALLIHGCIGTVYCWSLLYDYIKESITGNCTWAFSLAIFFLGISAAFFGPLVEKNVKKAATISSILFGSGMILSGVACYINSMPLLYLSYGAIMGTGVGIGYITPVKTLMMWFKNNKGLATGLAIMGFGLAKVIATPLLNWSIERCGIYCTFFSFGVWYTLIMLLAAILLKKPIEEGKIENTSRPKFKSLKEWFDRKKQLLNLPAITTIWLIFYLNISPQPGEERHHGRGGRDAEHGVHRQHQRHPRRSAGEPQHAALLGHHAERDRQHHEEVHEESEGDRDRQQERRKQEHPRYLLYGTGTRQVPGSETHRRLLPEHLRHRLLPYPQRDAGDRRQTDTGRLQRRLAARRTEPGAARLRDAEVPRQKHPTLSCYRCGCPRPGCGRSDTRDQLRLAR